MPVAKVRLSLRDLWWIMLLFDLTYSSGNNICASPQYVKLGTQDMISCTFPENFYGIYWYDHENVTSDDRPFISYVEGVNRGIGYDSNEYDILPNGSLIINSVSHLHDHSYGVALLENIERDHVFESVSVIVFAKPVGQYPNIECEEEKVCFLNVESPTSLRCSIDGVGEVIDDFSWMLRTKDRDENISSQQLIVPTSVNELQSYRVDVNVPLQASSSLSLYVCSSKSPVPDVGSGEAGILVDHGKRTQDEPSHTSLEKSLNESVTMECGGGTVFFLVWQKYNEDGVPIAYRVSQLGGERIQKTNRGGFTLEDDNSLTINAIDEQSAGVYTCLYSEDGITTSHISYDVNIQEKRNKEGRVFIIISVIVVIIFLVAVALVVFVMYRKKKTKGKIDGEKSQPERNPMITTPGNSEKESSSKVTISSIETREEHDETLQTLEKNPGIRVKLENSFLSVDNNGSALHLTSDAVMHPILTMGRLDFEFPINKWREIDITELKSILQYAARCDALKDIKFINSLLPFELGDSIKKMEKIRVEWTSNALPGILKLNCVTGKWKNSQDAELKEDEYKIIVKKARESMDTAEKIS